MPKAHREKSSSSQPAHTTVAAFANQIGIPARDAYALVDAGVIKTVSLGADEF